MTIKEIKESELRELEELNLELSSNPYYPETELRELEELDGLELSYNPYYPEEDLLTNESIQVIFHDHRSLDEKMHCFVTGSSSFKENEPWIQTYSGKRFTPLNPTMNSIVIQDIASALSMQCRFAGHINEFYSVAQHSVYVSYFCDSKYSLHGLLHDASEAYLVDIPSPLKRSELFSEYRKVEENLQKTIYRRFGLHEEESESVKRADKLMLGIEAKQLLSLRDDWTITDSIPPFLIKPLSPKDAKVLFLKRFFELMKFENHESYLLL